MSIHVIRQTSWGFITDTGENMDVRCDTGLAFTLGRYGVWIINRARMRPECIHVTANLEDANETLDSNK